MKILIAVTHLLGSGHLSRALTLGRAFTAAGHEVMLLSGGMPAPHFDTTGLRLVQLAPVRSDGVNFTRLLDKNGHDATEILMQSRANQMQTMVENFHPDALITELFPFGRRILRPEFLTLLKTAGDLTPRPKIYCSVRDILAPPSRPEKAGQAEEILSEHYDGVLVHSDPATTPLSKSWPVTDALAAKLNYTGYVAAPAAGPHPEGVGEGRIIVSAGGGSVGDTLFETALQASALSARHWHLLVGGADRDQRIRHLKSLSTGPNLTIEAARPDFRQMLFHAAAAVNMCGYNTAMDLLQSGVPSVLVPFDDGGEVEQSLRADSLSKRPNIRTLRSDQLTPAALHENVELVAALGHNPASDIGFDGARQTVRIVTDRHLQ